jgi:hypothetical protein
MLAKLAIPPQPGRALTPTIFPHVSMNAKSNHEPIGDPINPKTGYSVQTHLSEPNHLSCPNEKGAVHNLTKEFSPNRVVKRKISSLSINTKKKKQKFQKNNRSKTIKQKTQKRLAKFATSIRKYIIKKKFHHIMIPLDSNDQPIYETPVHIDSTDGIGTSIESMINDHVSGGQAGKHIIVNKSSQSFPDYFLKVSRKKVPVELKVFKGNSFSNDLGNLRVIIKKMANNDDGLDALLKAWYVIVNYTFDSRVIVPQNLFLKRIWQIAGRGPATGELTNGGSGCNLRPNTSTVKKLVSTPTTNTKEAFVEAVLDALRSDKPKCVDIRSKASITPADGIKMYNSILDQATKLNLVLKDEYTVMIQ